MSVNPVPEGFRTITPYLLINKAKEVAKFLQDAFAAEVLSYSEAPDGVLMNAELKIGDSMVMIADARDDMQPMPAMLYLYVPNLDELYQNAIKAGATSLLEPTDQFYGDRNAGLEDIAGNQWWLATHVEDVSVEEIERRMQALMAEA